MEIISSSYVVFLTRNLNENLQVALEKALCLDLYPVMEQGVRRVEKYAAL